jgi:1-acyl-sn-glycerol-3-phosphate acyltransferase
MAPLGWLCVLVLPSIESRWAVSRALLRLMARLSGTPLMLRGPGQIPNGPAVLVANHSSYLDGFALVAMLPRPVSFVAKSELGEHWLVGAILRRLGAVLVERFDTAQSIANAKSLGEQAASSDRPLLFFPEGTFDRMPGLLPFHMGAFLIAAQHRLPLVPIAIKGTRSMLRSEVWFPRSGRIEISIGEPITPPSERDDWTSAMALRDAARSVIEAGTGEASLAR